MKWVKINGKCLPCITKTMCFDFIQNQHFGYMVEPESKLEPVFSTGIGFLLESVL